MSLRVCLVLSVSFITAVVEAGPVGEQAKVSARQPTDSDSPLTRRVDNLVGEFFEGGRYSGAILIAKDGRPAVRVAYGYADWRMRIPNAPDTRFMIFSVSKQLTTALIMRLADHRKLSIDDPVSTYVENWPEEWSAVKVRHLLSHASGIDRDTLYFWLIRFHPQFWDDSAPEKPPYVAGPLLHEPGTTFQYANAGFTVLSLVAEGATGKKYADLMREEVFDPIGMHDTVLSWSRRDMPRARGHKLDPRMTTSEQDTHFITGAGDVVTTLDDMLRFDQALDGDAFLSAGAKQAIFTPYLAGKTYGDWAFGWRVLERKDRETLYLFTGGGAGFSAFVARMPKSHIYIALLQNFSAAQTSLDFELRMCELAESALGNAR